MFAAVFWVIAMSLGPVPQFHFIIIILFFYRWSQLTSPAATKHPQTMSLPSPCFTGGMRSFFLKCCLFYAKHFLCSGVNFKLIYPKILFQKAWSFSTFSLANFSHIFLREQSFLENVP